MKAYYTVAEVAAEFNVSTQAVRNWIRSGLLLAVQPASSRGVYRVPGPALDALRRRTGQLPPTPVKRTSADAKDVTPDTFYQEYISPALAETGLTADELLRRLASDPRLALRYPTFATEYSAYVRAMARASRRPAAARTVSA